MIVSDLYCGAGMAADGYIAAGLTVLGVDVREQPHYPYPFVLGDALDFLAGKMGDPWTDARHASPPCQLFTRAQHLRDAQGSTSKETVDLLTPTLALLRGRWNGMPWVVENVENVNAPAAVRRLGRKMMEPRDGEWLITLCGSSFGLGVRRHRLFLANFPLEGLACRHAEQGRPWGVYHTPNDSIPSGGRTAVDVEHGRQVMGVTRPIPWDSLKEGFPPAYTAFVGAQLAAHLGASVREDSA